MKFFLLTIFFFLPFSSYCQVTIEPHVNLSTVRIDVKDNPYEFPILLETNNAHQYGFGVEISSKLSKSIRLGLTTQFNSLINDGTYCTNAPNIVSLHFCSYRTKIGRWDNGLYLSYLMSEKISMGLGGHAVYQPFVGGNFFGRNSRSFRVTELGLGARIKIKIKGIALSVKYYHGVNLKDKGDRLYVIDPIRSLGLEFGVPIVLKRK